MVILRGCARCGGDIITGDAKNVRCLQCGHRPELPVADLTRRRRRASQNKAQEPVDVEALLRILETPDDAPEDIGDADSEALCPRCDETDAIALEKLRPHFNTCYRCRLCGHIFSPAQFKAAS